MPSCLRVYIGCACALSVNSLVFNGLQNNLTALPQAPPKATDYTHPVFLILFFLPQRYAKGFHKVPQRIKKTTQNLSKLSALYYH